VISDQCAKQGIECAHQARAASSKKQRDMLFALARSWDTLARQAARLETQQAGEPVEGQID
jgi:hypothetical protein